ncbi:MAG: universal stress protein [Thermodesulfobacteriota bacterium]
MAGGTGDHPCVCDEIIIQSGNPVEQILTQAASQRCDLIVIGSHGHGTIESKLIGGTARQVLDQSRTPVLLVRMPGDLG